MSNRCEASLVGWWPSRNIRLKPGDRCPVAALEGGRLCWAHQKAAERRAREADKRGDSQGNQAGR